MEISTRAMIKTVFTLLVWAAHGSGKRRAISKSNSRNVTATRKNFIEKGSRADPMGSKPHSYGLDFSAYVFNWGSQNAIKTRIEDSETLIIIVISIFIILPWILPGLADWKSAVLINTRRIRTSSVDRNVEEKSNYVYKVSISGCCLKSKMVFWSKMIF